MLSIKKPRDFVYVDELWEADELWAHYYIENKVWIYADEYHSELDGDQDYSRIIIHAGGDEGWLYSRALEHRQQVHSILDQIEVPVSEIQLAKIGFTPWQGSYL